MKAPIIRFLLVLPFIVSAWGLAAQTDALEPNWDRSLALRAVNRADLEVRLKPLFQMARAGESAALLGSLLAIEQDPGLPAPARDYLHFRFAVGLGDLDPNTVAPAVLEYLSTYEARTLIAHEEYPDVAVPLFNIPAAAAGVRNLWEREQAARQAQELLEGPADSWVNAYLAANRTARRGFLDALELASDAELRELGRAALARLDEQPELTLMVARAGLKSGDYDLLRQSIERGSGPELSQALQAAARELRAEECIGLLDHALRLGSDTKAALAIAHLGRARLDEPAVQQLLFDSLSDRELGAAAALALGTSPDPEVQSRLHEIASQESGLAKDRAALAIQSRRANGEAGS